MNISYRFNQEKTKASAVRLSLWRTLWPPILIGCALLLLVGCSGRSDRQQSAAEQVAEVDPASATAIPTFTPTTDPAQLASADASAANAAPAGDSQTPTAATPSATPSPSTPLGELANAQELLRHGDYSAARTQLSALRNAEDVVVRANAHFDLAKAYLADGLYAEALAALDLLAAESGAADADADAAGELFPAAQPRLTELSILQEMTPFLRGEALSGLGQYGDAIAAYTQFHEQHPGMSEGVQPQIAATYLAMGDADAASTAYRLAADAAGDRVAQVRYLEALAQTLMSAGRYADAVAAYDEILDLAQNSGYRTQILYQAGQTAATAGDEESAVAYWRSATAEAPANQYAYLALIELVNRQVEFDLYQRAYIDLLANAWYPAIDAYQSYLETAPPDDARVGLAMLGLGQAYLGAGDTASATVVLDNLLESYPDCDCLGQAWLEKARAQAAQGDSVSARRTYRTFAREYESDPLAVEALWQSGLSALGENNELEAAMDFLTLADRFPESERAPDALYAIGLGAFRAGLLTQAVEMFERLQNHYPLYRKDAVAYWLGRGYHQRDEIDAAHAQWSALAEEIPDTYYGVLAAEAIHSTQPRTTDVLTEMASIVGPPSTLDGDDGSQAFAERWLATWIDVDDDSTPLGALPESVANDEDLRLGEALLLLGRRSDALVALERVYTRFAEDPAALYALSLAFERMGAYRLSLLSMEKLVQLSPAALVEDAPVFLQKRIYPMRFEGLIEEQARAHDLNPLLLFSLIRQESLFEEGARSFAAAQGLAQVIPDTGEWVAEQLNYPNYTNALIYRPHINVMFGAFYLDWVRTYLEDDLLSALVGYNAGPGNADVWREQAGLDDALFVETLSVAEPRIYVQKIVSNLYHYTRLYGEE